MVIYNYINNVIQNTTVARLVFLHYFSVAYKTQLFLNAKKCYCMYSSKHTSSQAVLITVFLPPHASPVMQTAALQSPRGPLGPTRAPGPVTGKPSALASTRWHTPLPQLSQALLVLKTGSKHTQILIISMGQFLLLVILRYNAWVDYIR